MKWSQKWKERILAWLQPDDEFQLNVESIDRLVLIARQERRLPKDVAHDIIIDALDRLERQDDNYRVWHSLTPRQQQVVAMVCIPMTTPQIAVKLQLSEHTVREHINRAMQRFGVPNRTTLRKRLEGWDFSEWASKL